MKPPPSVEEIAHLLYEVDLHETTKDANPIESRWDDLPPSAQDAYERQADAILARVRESIPHFEGLWRDTQVAALRIVLAAPGRSRDDRAEHVGDPQGVGPLSPWGSQLGDGRPAPPTVSGVPEPGPGVRRRAPRRGGGAGQANAARAGGLKVIRTAPILRGLSPARARGTVMLVWLVEWLDWRKDCEWRPLGSRIEAFSSREHARLWRKSADADGTVTRIRRYRLVPVPVKGKKG